MKKIGLTILLVLFITSCFLLGTMLSETVRCEVLSSQNPDYRWEVKFVRCYAEVNGKWISADRFQHLGMSP